MTPSHPDSGLFVSLLILIVWLPIPAGSDSLWAWAIMAVVVWLLTIQWSIKFWLQQVTWTVASYRARPILILWGLWLGYLLMQCVPLPWAWITFLSPETAHLYSLNDTVPRYATLSIEPHATQVALLKTSSYILLFILILLLVNRRSRLRWVAYIVVFSGLFQAVYGSLMTLSGLEYGFILKKIHYVGNATGTFVNRNHLAGYLVMSLSLGIGLLIAQLQDTVSTNWRQRLFSLLEWLFSAKMRLRLYLVAIAIGLILTHSRMGNVAFLSSLMVAGIIGLVLSRHANRSTVTLFISLIVIDLMIMGAWFGIERVVQRLDIAYLGLEKRPYVNQYTMHYWHDYWWTGSGLGSFYSTFPRYQEQDLLGFYDHAHNDYLQFAAETGLIGIIIIGSCVLLSFSLTLWAQYQRHDPLCKGIAFGVMMGIIAMLMHSAVDFNLQIPANAATFMMLLALAWVASFLKPTQYHRSRQKPLKQDINPKT